VAFVSHPVPCMPDELATAQEAASEVVLNLHMIIYPGISFLLLELVDRLFLNLNLYDFFCRT
jgi:hypothetical protein